ncbi:hypothetical protein [Streptomyces tagetis]|uniref:Lipoprotein n=1 Tax=Streptomyces tagetis TaxID=2820809 RepID=A0A941B934_9ACTN|nr:hypothetical protein [Streptomyces sp. RG38]MBQ0829153.1 hypothetical protein [Streptomyces sp. RG38]
MRGRGSVAALGALGVLGGALLTGCQSPAGGAGRPAPAGASVAPSGFGAVFLAVGECSSFGTVGVREVPCAGERAAARVVARYDTAAGDGPLCPATTDFVLHVSEDGPARGYACMRSLQPPHPGDPGGGGGPRTIVGDCVYEAAAGTVRETACDGGGEHAPRYRVSDAVSARGDCPSGTALFVHLGGDRPVGCARPV